MKVVCVSSCIFRGDTVRKGAVLEVSEEEMKEYPAKSSFAPAMADGEGGASPSGNDGKPDGMHGARDGGGLVAGLTREQAVMKLFQAGVVVPEKISTSKLRERFEETFGAGGAE